MDFEGWEIVDAGFKTFIGKVKEVSRDFEFVILSPCYGYHEQVTATMIEPGKVMHSRMETIQPLAGSSLPPVLVRWTSRRALTDHDREDQLRYSKMVTEAERARESANNRVQPVPMILKAH